MEGKGFYITSAALFERYKIFVPCNSEKIISDNIQKFKIILKTLNHTLRQSTQLTALRFHLATEE